MGPVETINRLLRRLDLAVVRPSSLNYPHPRTLPPRSFAQDLNFLRSLDPEHIDRLIPNMEQSNSQLRQDLLVLEKLGYKRNGYFVEVGAADGVFFSNTLLLETEFAWTGILAEPSPRWHSALALHRSAARIDRRCVWSESNQIVDLLQPEDPALSTIQQFAESDLHAEARRGGELSQVETVSLVDLLKSHGAPTDVDYLSIDTEGSEYEILRTFDFDAYRFGTITCEHNHTPARQDIFELLTSHGYKRVHEDVSEFDDWYVPA